MRGCTPLMAEDEQLLLLCTKKFHQEKLEANKGLLARVFGTVEVVKSAEAYRNEMMKDPVVRDAVETLGAEIVVEE